MFVAFLGFIYLVFSAMKIVNNKYIGTSDGIYHSYISTSQDIEDKANSLTKSCEDRLCKVQSLLDYVSNIPYVSKTFQEFSPLDTMAQNFGDCDDKSNLLISLLYSLEIKAYFVLVPKHIFVIVSLDDKRLSGRKGLYVENIKYYLLESTAKDSRVGFELQYSLNQIQAIVDPFSNMTLKGDNLVWE